MNRKYLYPIILTLITLVAFAIRIINYQYPSLLWDEAALGYNAFSIFHTARDEYGQFLPLILKSFGDYKPGLYAYLSVPFVAIFGLNTLSVRLPSIILGSLLPLITYLLIKAINPKLAKIGLITALLIAFNPYNIHFSRGAWETNVLTFELVLGSLFLFKSIQKKSISLKYLLLAAFVFGDSLYTYQAGKMMSLFVIGLFFIFNYRHLLQNFKKVSLGFILPLAIIALPVAYGLLFGNSGNRLKVVSLLSYPRPQSEVALITSESSQLDYTIFHNPAVFFVQNFATRYFNHFSPRFLVFEGDWQNPRHSAVYIGMILYPSLIFLVLGIFSSFSRFTFPVSRFFLLWLLLAPIPAALTRDSVSGVRSQSMTIPLMYFTAAGIYFSYLFLKNKLLRLGFILISSFAFLLSFAYYTDLYYNHTVARSPMDYLYGYKEASNFVIANQDKYSYVYMTNFYGQPYIYYLFYSQYNPSLYQSQSHLTENAQGDTGKVDSIGKVNFASIPFELAQKQPSTLVIYSQDEVWRQGLDKLPVFKNFIPLSPIGQISTFYAYQNP